ncbi:hypothetical protein A7D27_06380 [Pseudomonas sp. 1D4]|uniref:hypothetical protein n=1 Tax=Pseudomonadaceae TaxID=135621 RepID=UPI00084B3094|nr:MULTISPECIES: hypothetical protein [Pseudomonas]OEC44944.1 hypothetical protein A7D27_06380 [Pseudomonas sp. 1D4]
MLKKLMAVGMVLAASQAFAWEDVEYAGTLATGAVYCKSQGKLEDFGAYAQDGDEAGADRMVAAGDCVIAQRPLQVSVFQEHDGFLSNFMTPSGKVFYTFKQFIN